MRLATVSVDGNAVCVAILANGSRLDVSRAIKMLMPDTALDVSTMQLIIEGGQTSLKALKAVVAAGEAGELKDLLVPEDTPLMSPIPTPRKNVFCVGRNYAEHIAEGERAQKEKIGVTEHPVFFTKPPTSVVAPDADILLFPSVSQSIDYEVELAVVIGKRGRNITKADAFNHVFGYSILNDITARDIQRRHGGQYFKGKGLDGSCPIGPCIVTADAISDPQALSIGLTVNGDQRQNGMTSDMIFDIPTLIASLSEGLTLEPGDIIATGTPSGVGYAMEPPQFLKNGDVVVCEVSEIGTLRNTVRAV
ncbi:fumarylacetoacetate hydrolase family protein [uncultured Ruegeria sp.]|uniref:fumarylacetoacetate hydrolase family protein n=1 Tax=uncultured Ruegeria sp. TaxID=259304 RepID=UPI0026369540|nr:fumarylacetoacetate hydrolase family protein [uncultured Ruegeria sp.]